MTAPRSSLTPTTASLTVIGIGAVLSAALGAIVGLITGDMAKSIGSVGTWGMVVTAIAAGGAAVMVSMQSESSEEPTS